MIQLIFPINWIIKRINMEIGVSILKTIRRLLWHVKSLGIFGSYVRKEAKKSSDLDVLVEFHQAPSLLQFIRMEDELSEKLGIKVDLVMKKALKTHIGRRIMAEVIPV